MNLSLSLSLSARRDLIDLDHCSENRGREIGMVIDITVDRRISRTCYG